MGHKKPRWEGRRCSQCRSADVTESILRHEVLYYDDQTQRVTHRAVAGRDVCVVCHACGFVAWVKEDR